MQVTKLKIENFRGIKALELTMAPRTVLIGENNVGKTTVLEALHVCLAKGLTKRASPFGDYDFRLTDSKTDLTQADPIVLTVTFEEREVGDWQDEIVQAFSSAVQLLDDGRQSLTFRVKGRFEEAVREVVVEWGFLDRTGALLPTARSPKLVYDLQQLAPVFLLSAVRDASQHFHIKSPFWSPFTRNPQWTDAERKQIEDQIDQLNQSVLDGHKPFEVVKERLSDAGRLLPLGKGELVSIEAVPARILDLLGRTQVKVAARTGARLPIVEHGAGTQSLSVLLLFDAFLQSRLAESYEEETEPILALEEPEAHLHPSAIRALWPMLEQLEGQQVIATHSGDLLAEVPLSAIRRLARRGGDVCAFSLNPNSLTADEQAKVSYHIRAKRGALMFARCWLLVEGESEYWILPELAKTLGHDLVLAGVACVEFAQCGLAPLIKLATDLGIEWHVLSDGDQAGRDYARSATRLIPAGEAPADRLSVLPEPIEQYFWQRGFQTVYESAVDARHRSRITSTPGTDGHRDETIKAAIGSESKPALAIAICAAVAAQGPGSVPTEIVQTIRKAIELAELSS